MTDTDLQIDLDWVTFSEEEDDDACQRVVFDCSNEAVYRVTWGRACCEIPRSLNYCVTCTETLSHCFGPCCGICRLPIQIVSILPIRGT